PELTHPGGQGALGRHPSRPTPTRSGAPGARRGVPPAGRDHRRDRGRISRRRGDGSTGVSASAWSEVRLVPAGSDPATDAGYEDHPPRLGFFTDTSICIGCKACEVACKEWNDVPEDGLNWAGRSHDNSVGLSGDTWRHVAFI